MYFSTNNLFSLWLNLFLALIANAVDIVSFDNCIVRFQTPRPGQSQLDARITQLNWPTTSADVARTINDYFNANGQNVQLFLSGGIGALDYANYINALCRTSHDGLNHDNTVISVLLPSGVAKVRPVIPSPDELGANRGVSGIFGISTIQPLLPTDWAYTTGALMKQAIAQWEVMWNRDRFMQGAVNLIRSDGTAVVMTMELFIQ